MPAPMVVAALIGAGTQLLKNLGQPAPAFQPPQFGGNRLPVAFQPPPQQADPFAGARSAIMDAFLQRQLGLGEAPGGGFGAGFGPPRLSGFNLRQSTLPPFSPRG